MFGATFVAVTYNHPIVKKSAMKDEIKSFIEKCVQIATSESALKKAEKECVYAVLCENHPFDRDVKIPVVIANFMLMNYEI